MISEKLYTEYFEHLLKGEKDACSRIVNHLLGGGVEIIDLYLELFQKSLYKVGELWEMNKITVAREHLITAISESLLNLVYLHICSVDTVAKGQIAVISCAANEYHQVGGKMIADLLQLHGWDSHFLGANTPEDQMLKYIDEVKPDLVGLSLSVYFNLSGLQHSVERILTNYRNLDILVGGQGFRWGGVEQFKEYPGVEYIADLRQLEGLLGGKLYAG